MGNKAQLIRNPAIRFIRACLRHPEDHPGLVVVRDHPFAERAFILRFLTVRIRPLDLIEGSIRTPHGRRGQSISGGRI